MTDEIDAFLDTPDEIDRFLDTPLSGTQAYTPSEVAFNPSARAQRQGATYTAPAPNITHRYRDPAITKEASKEFISGMGVTRGALNIGGNIVANLFGLDTKDLGTQVIGPETNKYMGVSTLGSLADPTSLLAGGAAGKAVSLVKPLTTAASGPVARTAERLVRTGAAGGLGGGASAGLASEGDLSAMGEGVLYGTGAGVVLPAAGQVAGWVGGKAADILAGRAGQVAAGKLARQALGADLPAMQTAMRNAPANQTAAQAGSNVDNNLWQALGETAAEQDASGYYSRLAQQQMRDRAAALRGVTPDQAAAEAARKATSGSLYQQAYQTVAKADVQLAQMASDPYFKEAHKLVKDLIDSKGLRFDTNPIEYLHQVKIGYDKMLNRTGDLALDAAEKRQVLQQKEALVKWMGTKAKAYEAARAVYAKMSGPVNQSKVLSEISTSLENPLGGERPMQFATAVQGEGARTIKRAGGDPRFGGLSDILEQPQMDVVNDVSSQLRQNAEMARMASEGRPALENMIREQGSTIHLPNFMSRTVSTLNNAINATSKYLSKATRQALVEGMKSGKNAEEMLAAIPAADRNKILMAMRQLQGTSGYAGSAVGSTMTPQQGLLTGNE